MNPVRPPFTDPLLEEALLYWRGKAADRPMPSRANLDPVEMPKLLPHVMLIDVVAPSRYRFRLIGTAIADEQGLNVTGSDVGEVLTGVQLRNHVVALLDECVRERRPLYSECLFFSSEGGLVERHTKRLFLPLSQDGESVNMIFKLQIFIHIDPMARERHFIEARPFKEIAHTLL
jgi:hypothetical protein